MDTMSPDIRSRVMARIKGKDTKPELLVRKYLWAHGYRYRKHVASLPGRPDIVIRRLKTVIFVHGCFWHGHQSHFRLPSSNMEFWQRKIRHNRARDIATRFQLQSMGWKVIVVWECQLERKVREKTLSHLVAELEKSAGGLTKLPRYAQPRPEEGSIAAETSAHYGKNQRPK